MIAPHTATADEVWLALWLDAVADGRSTMSQRSLRTIQKHGGLAAAIAAARNRGLHLVRLTDEHGTDLVAASRLPFETLC